jgi:hypothetical protein
LSLEIVIAGAMLVSLTFYALLAGADYGGGVWDLFARGSRANEQRALIAHAIGPIWEANHVWLILVVVILFTAFPPAFATITTALHIPLTLLLIGIVLRGSAFTFRTYDSQRDNVQRRWSRSLFNCEHHHTRFLRRDRRRALVGNDSRRERHPHLWFYYLVADTISVRGRVLRPVTFCFSGGGISNARDERARVAG